MKKIILPCLSGYLILFMLACHTTSPIPADLVEDDESQTTFDSMAEAYFIHRDKEVELALLETERNEKEAEKQKRIFIAQEIEFEENNQGMLLSLERQYHNTFDGMVEEYFIQRDKEVELALLESDRNEKEAEEQERRLITEEMEEINEQTLLSWQQEEYYSTSEVQVGFDILEEVGTYLGLQVKYDESLADEEFKIYQEALAWLEVKRKFVKDTGVCLAKFHADTPDSMWEKFFVYHGAKEAWQILQKREDRLTFYLYSLTDPLLSISKQEQINQVVTGIIYYLDLHKIAIRYLHYVGNQLASLHDEISNLTSLINNRISLKALNLSDNYFTALPPTISKLTKLQILNLQSNQLLSLPDEIGNLTSLTELNLGYNQLSSLPNTIGNLTKLQILNLQKNQLSSLPNTIGNLTSLTKLELFNNHLIALPSKILEAAQKDLDLSSNHIAALPASIQQDKIAHSNLLLTVSCGKLNGNPWLVPSELSPINKNILENVLNNYAYQALPHSLCILCMKYIENYLQINPDQQEAVEINLPEELSQSERKKKLLIEECKFEFGKKIIFFEETSSKFHHLNIPYYLNHPIYTYQDIKNIIESLKGKQLYQIPDIAA